MILTMGELLNKFIPAICFLYLFGCGWRDHPVQQNNNSDRSKEQLIGANKHLLERDAELIESFIKRRNWNMKSTKSGLYYSIDEVGDGEIAQRGDIISLRYKVSLLDGTLCYSSDINGPLVFKIGQGGIEAGIEEASLMLSTGDKARLILPPFLAHGLTGDQDKIPPRAVIVYELEVLSLKRQHKPGIHH
jgi:FKBP-type peptidyl-prolyl cis-trans isomerase FkpA